LYYIDERVAIHKVGDVLDCPGARYTILYTIASAAHTRSGDPAGKVMALAAYGHSGKRTSKQQEQLDFVFSRDPWPLVSAKRKAADNPYFRIGVDSQEFKDLARHLSDEMFDRFHRFAQQHVRPGLPLLIGGGCGLNCEWNSRWRECGLFSDVFVPPCANDS